ncbi:DUF7289 family protein [Halospeciosus flavus]|uniref:DUF7289 family protein n=1 Tax=Halospeciosus flavus TaxID=3032283 RepID=UPI003624624D
MRGPGTPSDDAPDRGQSEVIGTILLLSITILVVGVVVGVAGSALDQTRSTTEVQGVEQSLTLLDSRAALVALGKSSSQHVALGRVTNGHYTVNESAGWIEIRHLNYTGDESSESERILRSNLGVVRYEAEGSDVSLAYQGGGVWRGAGEGSVMLSPPEFHYRGETLTFPLIQVVGRDSASGPVEALVTERTVGQPVYPSAETYNNTSRTYRNPIQNGTLQITVHSKFCGGGGATSSSEPVRTSRRVPTRQSPPT